MRESGGAAVADDAGLMALMLLQAGIKFLEWVIRGDEENARGKISKQQLLSKTCWLKEWDQRGGSGMRQGPAVVQSLSAALPAFPPSTHPGSHCSPHTPHKKKLQTQAAITGRTKVSSPDLQSTGNSKRIGKGVICLFFWDLLLPRHPGYECGSFCWIITVESMGMWFILN